MSRGVFVATVVIVAIIALGAGMYVGKDVLGSSSSAASKYFVVGTNIPFPPFEDYNYSTGTYFGFDINMSDLIAAAMHRTLVIDNYNDFALLLTQTGAGILDMAASAITESGGVGALRNQTMSFSIPYYEANQVVLVQNSSSVHCPSTGCTVANLSTLTIGVQAGTSSQDWTNGNLTSANGFTGKVIAYVTVDTEITALESGAISAVIIDTGPGAAYVAGSGGTLREAGLIHTHELYGFAVQHGDPNGYLPVINSVITNCMNNGTYQKLIQEWGLG